VQTDGCYSASCKAAPAAVPSRLGCPSPIKHIFLIVRENRTCDQVFGHNWLMQADANDYIEKEFGAFYRSYPPSGATLSPTSETGSCGTPPRPPARRSSPTGSTTTSSPR